MKNKKKIKTIFIASVILLIFFSSLSFSFAAPYTNQEKIPGAEPTSEFIPYLQSIINFGFAIIGILALFMLIIGAYQYLMAAGSGKAEDAKDTITSALLGLALGLTAWIILNKINPDLVNMRGITQIAGGAVGTGTPGTTPSGGGALSPSDMSKVKCDTVRNYNGFMNKNLSDGLYNENIKSAEDMRNALEKFRAGSTNGLTKYADIIYQASQDAKAPAFFVIGVLAHESNMLNEFKNGKDGERYGCSYYHNPGCILDPATGKPKWYPDDETGIRENIATMGRRLSENPTPLGAWNAWYWPDRPGNCAGAQSYLDKFNQAAKATGLSGI